MDGELGAFQIVTPVFHGFDNCEHFAVVDIVVTFCRMALARPECDGMEDAVMRLANNAG